MKRAYATTQPRIDGAFGCLGCLCIETDPAQLHDGRTVCGSCFELADEREAMNIVRIESKQARADELLKIEIRRGKASADRLRAKVALFWELRGAA